MALKRTQEQFVSEMSRVNPDIKILGLYAGVGKRVKVQCRKCNRVWSANAGNLLHGAGCIDCSGYRNDRKSHEEFKSEVEQVAPNITILGTYKDTKHKVLCRCDSCGNEWNANPSTLRKGHGCPLCARKNLPGRSPISHNEFLSRIHAKNPSIVLKSSYVTAHDEVSCSCEVCGYEWTAIASALEKNCFCPKCRKKELKEKRAARFFDIAAERFPTIEVRGEYVDSNTPISCRCRICNHHWDKPPVTLLRSSGCPVCRKQEIVQALSKSHEAFVKELKNVNRKLRCWVDTLIAIRNLSFVVGFVAMIGLLFLSRCLMGVAALNAQYLEPRIWSSFFFMHLNISSARERLYHATKRQSGRSLISSFPIISLP